MICGMHQVRGLEPRTVRPTGIKSACAVGLLEGLMWRRAMARLLDVSLVLN